MKKKVWDITVKDNPNRVIMGENDEFYTTDTEAYLVFNLQDKDFSPPSAVLTLENRSDGSLKDETVDVVDGLIEWEMPQRYIEHFGNWQGQLVYEDTKDGQPELYTSATFSFVVNAHIGDKKKPSLVEIENWEKFIRDGTELIETWEDMEDLRQANEAQRQDNYQELLDTGVLQTNINTKLEALEEEYAPKLTEVTSQLAQTTKQLDRTTEYATSKFNYLNDSKKERKVMVSFIADDAPKNDLTKLLPIIQEKNVPVGIGVVTDVVGKTTVLGHNVEDGPVEFMTWDEIRYMESQGAEIMAHTHKHRDSQSLRNDLLYDDVKTNKEILTKQGFIADGFIYPYNSFDEETKKIVSEFFKYSFARYTENTPTIDNNSINRYSLGAYYDSPSMAPNGDPTSLEYYKYRVDQAIENDEWLVFVLHTQLDNFPPEQQQHMRDIIDYIRSLGVEIVSPREGFERYGNVLQVGDLKIDAKGDFNFEVIKYLDSAFMLGINGLSPITDFEKGKISIHRVGRSNVTPENGFPVTGLFGTLKTVYFMDDTGGAWSNQKLEVFDDSTNRFINYIRFWNWDIGEWSDWVLGAGEIPQTLDIHNLNQTFIDVSNVDTINIKGVGENVQLSELLGGVNGQRITLLVTSHTPLEFVNRDGYAVDSLHLKGNENRSLGIRESITFTRISNDWYEL